MEETVPVLAGVVGALLSAFVPVLAARSFLLPLVCALAGAAWSFFIGETNESWAFALVDAAQAVAAYWLVRWAARRARAWRAGSQGRG